MADYQIKVWRQSPTGNGPGGKEGNFETYAINNIDADISFLEMLDMLNQQLILVLLLIVNYCD